MMHTLAAEFTILQVVNGETVAADNLGVTNGFVKSKLGMNHKKRVLGNVVLKNLATVQNICMACIMAMETQGLCPLCTCILQTM